MPLLSVANKNLKSSLSFLVKKRGVIIAIFINVPTFLMIGGNNQDKKLAHVESVCHCEVLIRTSILHQDELANFV